MYKPLVHMLQHLQLTGNPAAVPYLLLPPLLPQLLLLQSTSLFFADVL